MSEAHMEPRFSASKALLLTHSAAGKVSLQFDVYGKSIWL